MEDSRCERNFYVCKCKTILRTCLLKAESNKQTNKENIQNNETREEVGRNYISMRKKSKKRMMYINKEKHSMRFKKNTPSYIFLDQCMSFFLIQKSQFRNDQ